MKKHVLLLLLGLFVIHAAISNPGDGIEVSHGITAWPSGILVFGVDDDVNDLFAWAPLPTGYGLDLRHDIEGGTGLWSVYGGINAMYLSGGYNRDSSGLVIEPGTPASASLRGKYWYFNTGATLGIDRELASQSAPRVGSTNYFAEYRSQLRDNFDSGLFYASSIPSALMTSGVPDAEWDFENVVATGIRADHTFRAHGDRRPALGGCSGTVSAELAPAFLNPFADYARGAARVSYFTPLLDVSPRSELNVFSMHLENSIAVNALVPLGTDGYATVMARDRNRIAPEAVSWRRTIGTDVALTAMHETRLYFHGPAISRPDIYVEAYLVAGGGYYADSSLGLSDYMVGTGLVTYVSVLDLAEVGVAVYYEPMAPTEEQIVFEFIFG